MFKFLFGLILLVVLFLMLTGALGVRILRALFGFGRKPSQRQQEPPTSYSRPRSRKKIFEKHEGEYVDFEEIKEDSLEEQNK